MPRTQQHRRLHLPYVLALLAVFGMNAVHAKSDYERDHERDHDKARELSEAGEILPLETILQKLKQVYPGRVLEVELEREHGRMVYEIELLDERGVVRELYYDAASGELLKDKRDRP